MSAFGPFEPPPEPEFRRAANVYEYCTAYSARLGAMALEHEIAALQLQKALGQVPDDRMGMRSKVKARLVAGHVRRAGAACEAASARLTAAYVGLVAAKDRAETVAAQAAKRDSEAVAKAARLARREGA